MCCGRVREVLEWWRRGACVGIKARRGCVGVVASRLSEVTHMDPQWIVCRLRGGGWAD